MVFSENLWTINITSFANTHALSPQLIEDALNGYKVESHQQNYTDKIQQRLLTYNDDKIASWQINKGVEIYQKRFESFTHTIDGDKVTLSVKFEIGFPYDWNISDVIDWTAGFSNECLIIFIQNKCESVMTLFKSNIHYRTQVDFLRELCDNESTIATNNSKTPPQIKFEGLTFDFQIISEGEAGTSDGDKYRMGYSLADCNPSSSHYQMWAEYGCWLNPFQENKSQTFLWLREGIETPRDFEQALMNCEAFLKSNELF